ncbi:penicillin-binding protein [Bacillus sp. 165]|uniref:penicillin-binding protein n=1 Tax=Bacillus sp. 165 TaxID=1529117 RepID=UPI001ADB8658|nr:penicillin-binding protein [Bacillus sp. 165]MBO9130269.1 PASTA domain-containing protein [Bacillus sp. 165]
MLLFALLFFLLFGRFLYIQVFATVHGESLKKLAQAKHNKSIKIEGKRGTIFDFNKIPLAQDTKAYKVVAVLKGDEKVENKEETAQKLAIVLGVDREEIAKRLNTEAYQVEFGTAGRGLSKEQKLQIENLELPGITFIEEKARIYPNGDFASYILGFAKMNDDDQIEGRFGLEKSLDKYLKAEDGYVKFEGDSRGNKFAKTPEDIKSAKDGSNVYLTINQRIQGFLENAMKKADEEYQPSDLIAIVAEAKTGKILAMSSRPSFDPNKRNITYFNNDPIYNAYEPGSTMKIFTLAAAVNEGVYNGSEYYQSGAYQVGTRKIKDHNDVGWGSITFDEGVQRSSNVAFSILAEQKLGFDRYYEYLHKFGLDKKTGIDLPGEGRNTILSKSSLNKITTAFGQGSTVTPIQQVQAATAIANDGNMMKPYIIERIVNPQSKKVQLQNSPEVVSKPITKETAKQVRELLETVVSSEKGTGKPYRIDGYSVAGKTGTAQIVDPTTGRYMTGRENYRFSFLGMVPAENPDIIVYLSIKQPKLKPTDAGSTPLAEIFKSVAKNTLPYRDIKKKELKQPSKAVKKKSIIVPDLTGLSAKDAKAALEKLGAKPILLGDGRVEKQYPSSEESVLKGERVILITKGKSTLPDMTGWSLREVTAITDLLELKFTASGEGYVTKQSIQSGSQVKAGDTLQVTFSPPQKPKQEDKKESKERFTGG